MGLGSLGDYGGLFSLLAFNTLGADKLREIGHYEGGKNETGSSVGYVNEDSFNVWDGVVKAPNSATNETNGPKMVSNWLGVLGGNFMRYLDTNLLPDIEIRITLASSVVLECATAATAATFLVQTNSMTFETIAFGDDSYRQMVDARLASGEPIVVPFQNFASYESSNSGSTSTTQFTVATQSLNGLLGSVRVGTYDSALSNVANWRAGANTCVTNTEYFGFGGGNAASLPINASTTFQFAIDSKV